MTRAERRRAKRKKNKNLRRRKPQPVYGCPFCNALFKKLEDLIEHQDRLGHVVPI